MTAAPTPGRTLLPAPVTTLPDLGITTGGVALTFDDGPEPPWTEAVLDLLAQHDAKATFFVVGQRAQQHPRLLRRIHNDGHTIGIHTWTHPRLPDLTPHQRWGEITRTHGLIHAVTGQHPHHLRPPYGDTTPQVVAEAEQLGYRTVCWSAHSRDWDQPGTDVILGDILPGVVDGAVVLLHDASGDRAQTVEALAVILDTIAERRLKPVALPR